MNSDFKPILSGLLLLAVWYAEAGERDLKIARRYLNLPVSHQTERQVMTLTVDGKTERTFEIRLADAPDYWVFCDVSAFKGKTVRIAYPADRTALEQIYQSDTIAGHDSLYREHNRPQIHFTSRRGWNNDPNGLLYYDGEYHLFYQHNPYEREWGNMHWGHAVSADLVHWEELPPALFPDEHGTMFSGSAVVDYRNTAGFNSGNTPAMIAIYTADSPDKQVQCIAYSTDRGRTWTKYANNPVVDSKARWDSKDTRDPKVFWYEPDSKWIMALNERDGHSIYTSTNLKDWNYESHTTGFWECPELFELPVDGDTKRTRWVMYGASGTYMTGSFDGKTFTPDAGKYYYTAGAVYAAQTFTNMPAADSRRIQIGWGRISHPDMPFNGMMLLPTELTLRSGKDGIRLFSYPVKEIESLQKTVHSARSLTASEAGEILRPYSDSACLRIQVTLRLSHATDAGLNLYGQQLLKYDLNFNQVNGVFYSPDNRTGMEISADIILDRTSVEVFIDGGAYSFSMERRANPANKEGFHFWGNNIEIKEMTLYTLQSIWQGGFKK